MPKASALSQFATPATQMAKTTGSLALFCLRLPLYCLAFLLFALMASSVYYVVSLYQDLKEVPTDSQEIAAAITQFGQQLLAPRTIPDANNPNQNTTEPLSLWAIPLMAPDSTVDNHTTGSTTATLDSTDVKHAQERFAILAPRSSASAHTQAQAQNPATTTQESTTATLPAVTQVATPVRTFSSSTASTSPYSRRAPASAARAHRSVAERMAANNKAVDERVDAILKSRELSRSQALAVATQDAKPKKDHAQAAVNADSPSVIAGS